MLQKEIDIQRLGRILGDITSTMIYSVTNAKGSNG